MHAKTWNGLDHLRHLRRRDQPRAFEMPRRILMPRAPQGNPYDRNDARGSFQHELHACQLITRYGVENSLVGCVNPLISTTGHPADQASHASPDDRPTNIAAWRSRRALDQRAVTGFVLGAIRNSASTSG